jgi:hypothetical protein
MIVRNYNKQCVFGRVVELIKKLDMSKVLMLMAALVKSIQW